ncbi:valine--tRNA ligase [uncultured Alistipes sp.]|jgi:valyl-tRNA synthetase|uniref:valine--tRNA ligase n=1 Tax=uncultured Alistipes sp. TaxID=538949 RepID=UPI00261B137A|nr:valine--tRNA ligase [uncultured Alistipes sp.]
MHIAEKYSPQQIEAKWYDYWTEHRLFHSEPDEREPYTIVIPPPNVTGMLHMGHMLNNTLQDVLVRRARMKGKNACWVPGMDHASIATEAKVVARLREQGIEKSSLTREEFLRHAWEWKEQYGGVILRQLRKLGASCDWDRTVFTMDEARTESVLRVFCDLYEKGRIYRGVRMVNWDPAARTALSDEEVIFRESHGKLYYLRYRVEGMDRDVIVATTRPETILGDTALCVNPNDPRYDWLPQDARVTVPLVGRTIPVIRDEYVDIEFGTGALKVTPAHDVNDYMLGEKYGLETIDIFNDDGTINDKAGLYAGEDRFEVRRRIEGDLDAAGLLEKTEAYTNNVGYSERTGVAIEPKLSMQWFLSMNELAGPATRAVLDDVIRFVPEKYKNTYRHWMENIKDWCISRQLWWGQRIPAWYLPKGGFVVAPTEEEALAKAREATGDAALRLEDLRQDEDVLDTWFSSWLWPISVFDGIRRPDNAEIRYYYPTADLVTGPDIIFFWVARMIMAGYEYRGTMPFRNVYFTGIVRDKIGRKMSKQLGNSPDPLDLIAKYGADGMRVAMLLSSSAGNDVMFDEALCEQGRNFGNKIWNAYRLIGGWSVDPAAAQSENDRLAVAWFEQALGRALRQIEEDFAQYRISEALMKAYKLFWDDFSGLYLEMVKPAYGTPADAATLAATKRFFDALMRILHPFMPFVTEEIWQDLAPRAAGESIMTAPMPEPAAEDARMLARFDLAHEVVSAVRNIRNKKNLPQKETLVLRVIADENYPAEFAPVIRKMANLSQIETATEKDPAAAAFLVKTTQYFVPLAGCIDPEAERRKLADDLTYYEGFLASVMKKLSNERFVQSAPEKVVANERAKQADAEAKIAAIRAQLAALE